MISTKPLKSLVNLAVIIMCLSFFVACSSTRKANRDFLYFQKGLDSLGIVQQKETIIKTNDILNIQISSKSINQEQAAVFNVPNGNNNTTSGYQVSNTGTIDLPLIGQVKAAGLTKIQLQSLLAERISPYVKDPLVIVRFLQFNVNVLGEVRAPGTKTFMSDRVSIIDAISASGDMTDFGRKDNVVVIREESGKRSYYTLDLRSGGVFQSPAYLLQPNDIVYVEPNNVRIRNVNFDPREQERSRFWIYLGSFSISLASFIIAIVRSR